MEKKTIDDVFGMCDSRYELVNLIAARAREIAEDPNRRDKPIKPVNYVLNNLMTGRAVICQQNSAAVVYSDDDFELTVSAEEPQTESFDDEDWDDEEEEDDEEE